MTDRPVFYYDFASPACYLAAERMTGGLPVVPDWQPVAASALPRSASLDAFRCAEEINVHRYEIERNAAAMDLQPLRWPQPWPSDSTLALLAATYARSIGRVVAFSLAAFRQAYAGGRDLAELDTVLIAAAANEMHPRAVTKGIELKSTHAALANASEAAARGGVTELPAIRVGDELFCGAGAISDATDAMEALAA